MLGGTKYIMSPLFKSWGDMSPRSPHKLGPCQTVINNAVSIQMLSVALN